MTRLFAPLYGVACYALFFVTFLYAVGFVTNRVVPTSVDVGRVDTLATSLVIDVLLLGVFAIQHSVMARRGFKRWWTRIVPKSIERSTYVLLSSLALGLLYWQWRTLPMPVWQARDPELRLMLDAIGALGWLTVLGSTFLLSHFELFGLRQVYNAMRGHTEPPPVLHTPGLYKVVRHPIYLGFLIAFWSTPDMTVGHLLFAIGCSGYILIGIALEERDLIATFGESYRRYRGEVRALLPLPKLRAKQGDRKAA